MTSLPNCVNLEGSAEGGRVRGIVCMGMKIVLYVCAMIGTESLSAQHCLS
jgi:hypothetical protein